MKELIKKLVLLMLCKELGQKEHIQLKFVVV